MESMHYFFPKQIYIFVTVTYGIFTLPNSGSESYFEKVALRLLGTESIINTETKTIDIHRKPSERRSQIR